MTMKQPFERAVEQHGATVLRVCRAALGASPDADDAWSETFMAALRAWPGLDEDANVEAWLVRIAQHKTIDVVRARSRRPTPVADPPEGASRHGRPGDHDIWSLVGELPERQRLAIAYHYLGGLPHTETAALIGGSPDAVRRAASDGLKTLRRRLRPGTGDHS
ncbi:RNA polymerase subunit sigma-24 [Acidipropionibacterium acidipropionici]|nr:RNA polymerase subunit sigma-24 [Acidipropionibacterium acidipropionici]APZ10465.1 RNA polymerase subunit sigma-24 [Acidipropionibacterium acidipropionici]